MMLRRMGLALMSIGLLTGTTLVLGANPPSLPPARTGSAPLPEMPQAAAPRAALVATSSRSLFRPAIAEPPKASAASSPAAKPRLRLVGVVIAESRPVGLIEQEGSGMRRVSVGDEIGGWRVEAIEARTVRLSRDSQQADYLLDPQPGSR